jgi:hypothetical protein
MENCRFFRRILGAEYCAYDVKKHNWEEKTKEYEIFCDRFLSKNASIEELLKYRRKQIKLELWEELKYLLILPRISI